MTLNMKFFYTTFFHSNENRCEQIADEFAIGFGQWMTSGVEFMDDTERGRVYYFKKKLYTTKELLEIYKKEKGL
jgi:hypothetical protein